MFSGIVQTIGEVISGEITNTGARIRVSAASEFVDGLEIGASVSVDGVCLTVVQIDGGTIAFDVMPESIRKTTLGGLKVESRVNLERSIRVGDEIGGHLLSGHVKTMAEIDRIDESAGYAVWLAIDAELMKYMFEKGFIAIDGISLTIVDVDRDNGRFSVHLIPETRERTTLGKKKAGDKVNIEIDSMTQMVVDTVERVMGSK